jgi:hypothetical protein
VTLGTQAATLDAATGKAVAGVGAVALALAPIVRARWAGEANIRDWVRSRSVSESLKTEIYLRLTRSGAYRTGDPDRTLDARRTEVEGAVTDLARHALRIQVKTRPRPAVTDVDSYVNLRVVHQIDTYYVPNSRNLAERVMWLRRAEAALTLVAAGLAALAVALGTDGPAAWVPVVTAAAGAVTAHIAAGRYDHNVISYHATAQRLIALRDRWRDDGHSEGFDSSAFVVECENVISSENQEWMAAWLRAEA